ncbi:MAG: FG-GAP repeat domain-containing protein [Phycisphaerales bacterium]
MCAQVAFCCDTSWDMFCAELANSICGACSADCDGDGTPDACEIDAWGYDAQHRRVNRPDGVPDDCQPASDCNGNGIDDALDISTQRSIDCNRNGIPDECERAANPGLDLDDNGVLDACEGNPCDAEWCGERVVHWIGPPISRQPFESAANWLPSRPGTQSTIGDALTTSRRMDAALHCDRTAHRIALQATDALLELDTHILRLVTPVPGGDCPPPPPGGFGAGGVFLSGAASLQLDPRRTAPGGANSLMQADTIEAYGIAALSCQFTSSPWTDIAVSGAVTLTNTEVVLRGTTSAASMRILDGSEIDARGNLVPAPGASLQVEFASTVRGWRLGFDHDDTMFVRTGANGWVRHASTQTSAANLLLLWDWSEVPNESAPILDTDSELVIRGALQIDAGLTAGRMPTADSMPRVTLLRQSVAACNERYGLVVGTPPRGWRYAQIAESMPGASRLDLALLPEPAVDPRLNPGYQAPLEGTEVGKVAIDLNNDGADEIVVAVRTTGVSGELRVYEWTRGEDGLPILRLNASMTRVLTGGQPIIPWDGTRGDGQPLDTGDFDGDGRMDLAVACEGGAPFRLYRNAGNGLVLHAFADPLPVGDRATCVAILPPSQSGGALVLQQNGFAGGVQSGGTGKLNQYPVSGGAAIATQQLAGLPRSVRGSGSGGKKGVEVVTGGGTKPADFDFVASASEAFIQLCKLDEAGSIAPPLPPALVPYAPRDLALLTIPNAGGSPRLCVAAANVSNKVADMTLLHGADPSDAAAETGFDAIASLSTASGTQGARNIVATPLFTKVSGAVPDLLVTRADGRVVAARTDADDRGSVSLGYLVTLAQLSAGTTHSAAGGTFGAVRGVVSTVSLGSSIAAGFDTLQMQTIQGVSGSRGPTLPDFDGSGFVDFSDVALVLLDFGPCAGCLTDLDQNEFIDFGDVALVLLAFGETP